MQSCHYQLQRIVQFLWMLQFVRNPSLGIYLNFLATNYCNLRDDNLHGFIASGYVSQFFNEH